MSAIANSIKGSLNVITGCANGLGRATLERFLKHGSGQILAIDRRFEPNFVDKLDLTDEEKGRIEIGCCDTFDEQGVASSLEKFVAKNGHVDNLINVAGVSLAFTFFLASQDPAKHKFYDLKHTNDLNRFNTVGTFNMIRLAARYMMDQEPNGQRSKCIVNTSCISTTKPSIGQTYYAASKSAIDSLTLCVAREFSRVNIRCNTINVGFFDTQLLRANESKVYDYLVSEVVQCPKKLGHPDEFAHLVQALIENKMLNGACIKLDAATEAAQERPAGRSAGQM